MKNLSAREFHVQAYHLGAHKIVGVSYSNFMFRLYCNLMNQFFHFFYFFLGLSSDPNINFIKNLSPREGDVPTYLFKVQKIVDISSSRVVFRVEHE